MTHTKPTRAIGYGRVSRRSGREGESFLSPRQQEDAVARWARDRDVQLVAHLHEDDVSGGTIDRPRFQEALGRIEAGDADTLVVAKLNRFARSVLGAWQAIERLQAAGATFVSVEEGIDLSTPAGQLQFNLMQAFAQFELDNLKAGWRSAKREAIEGGRVIGPTPWGYRRAGVKGGRPAGGLVVDEVRGPLVTRAYELAAERGLDAAVAYLAAQAPDRSWNRFTTRRLLASPAYMGVAKYGALENQRAHESLVDGDVWRRVQRRLGARTPRRRAASEYPLSGGPAVCASCGRPLSSGRGGPGIRMYRCVTRRRGGHCADPAMVQADALERLVVELLVARVVALEEDLEPDVTWAEAVPTGWTLGPEDMAVEVAEARAGLERALGALREVEEASFPSEAIRDAAVQAADNEVALARVALAEAESEASVAEEGPPESVEAASILMEDSSRLDELLGRYGWVVHVGPSHKGRVPLEERVELRPGPSLEAQGSASTA